MNSRDMVSKTSSEFTCSEAYSRLWSVLLLKKKQKTQFN